MKSKVKPAKSRRDRSKKQSCIISVQDLEKDILLFKHSLFGLFFFLTAVNKSGNPLNPISEFALHKGELPPKNSIAIWFIGKVPNQETEGQKKLSCATSWYQDKHKNWGTDADLQLVGLNLKLKKTHSSRAHPSSGSHAFPRPRSQPGAGHKNGKHFGRPTKASCLERHRSTGTNGAGPAPRQTYQSSLADVVLETHKICYRYGYPCLR